MRSLFRTSATALMAAAWIGSFGPRGAEAQDDPSAMMPKPTTEHKRLEMAVGTWDATVKSYMGGADSPPDTAKGVETNAMLGGLWLASDFEGDFGGWKFEGRGQTGYDSKKGKYVGTWIDTANDRLTVMEGAYDPDLDAIVYRFDSVDYMTGEPFREKHVLTVSDPDTRTLKAYKVGEKGADDVLIMRIDYKRRPASSR